MTYPASNRHSRTGPHPVRPPHRARPREGRQHCHAARDAARAPAPTRLEVRNSLVRVHRNSLVRVHPYRSRRGRPGPNTAARAVGPLQIGSSTSGGQPEGYLAVRAWAGHTSRTGVEVSAHRDHGALLPRQHSRCAGVRGAERTSKEHRSDQPGGQPRDQNRRTGGLVAQRADPCYRPIDPFPLPVLCRRALSSAASDPAAWPLGKR